MHFSDWPKSKLMRKLLFSGLFIFSISIINYNILMNRSLLSRRILKQYEKLGHMDEEDFKFWDFIKMKIQRGANQENQTTESQEINQ